MRDIKKLARLIANGSCQMCEKTQVPLGDCMKELILYTVEISDLSLDEINQLIGEFALVIDPVTKKKLREMSNESR